MKGNKGRKGVGLNSILSNCFRQFRMILRDNSGVDEVIGKKQPYQLLNNNHEFFRSFDASSFHKLVDETS